MGGGNVEGVTVGGGEVFSPRLLQGLDEVVVPLLPLASCYSATGDDAW
jgi:hypothetical protein